MSSITQSTVPVNPPVTSESVAENNTNEEVPQQSQVNILDVDVSDENVALNLLVNFVNIAQKRGVYSLPEASKIWECVRKFQKKTE
tara:strand:+ start:15929 stop:16186 length:258 start_codon:yes stop_codon:yes gene_type:complete